MREFSPLFLLSLSAAVMVASAYAQQYLAIDQAQHALFPAATHFFPEPVLLTAAQRDLIEEKSGVRQRWEMQDVWRAELESKLGKDKSNLSGATLSCRNVSNGVMRLLALQEVALSHGK